MKPKQTNKLTSSSLLTLFVLSAWFILGSLTASAQIVGGPINSTNAPVTLDEDTQITIQLATLIACTNTPAGSSTVTITAGPAHGSLSSNLATNFPTATYRPATNYNGPDSFTWTVTADGCFPSTYTQPITVNPVNDRPIAQGFSVRVSADTPTPIGLIGADVDGDPLTFQINSPPAHGTLSGTPPNLTYSPSHGFIGSDAFTYSANDGHTNSSLATVAIGVVQIPSNQCLSTNPPVTVVEDTPLTFTLQSPISVCAGPIGPVLLSAFGVGHGTVTTTNSSVNPPTFTYTPFTNYNGPDTLQWTLIQSNCCDITVTVPITVTPVNDAPKASNLSVVCAANQSITIPLTGSDVDGDPLTFSAGFASHGTVSITLGSNVVTYTPNRNYIGPDSFSYSVSDGQATANATVSIAVKNGLTISNVMLQEGNSGTTNAIFTVNLTGPLVQPLSVSFRTTNGTAGPGTAVAGSDYQAVSGNLNFIVGGLNFRLIGVPVFGDRVFELNEQFSVQLFSPSNAVLVTSNGLCTILNDDPLIGVTEGIPSEVIVKVHERFSYGIQWTHPVRWRLLDTVDIRIIDDEDSVLNVRFDEADNTFSLFNPANGKFLHPDAPGSRTHFETDAAVMYLENSQVLGSGPTGPSVLLNLNLSFKPKAAGRVFRVEAFATDDDGNQQGFDEAGIIGVFKK